MQPLCASRGNLTGRLVLDPRLYLQGKQSAYIYARYIWTGGEKRRGFFRAGIQEIRRRRARQKGREKGEGIPDGGAKVPLENPVTSRRHWGSVRGMWSHQPSALSPPSTQHSRYGSPFPRKQTSPFILVARARPDSPFILTALRRSGHVSFGGVSSVVAPAAPFPSPRLTSLPAYLTERPKPVSTLVINTNCSIQTFEMCLTFLWHVILSPTPSLPA